MATLGGPQIGGVSIIVHLGINTFFHAAKWISGKLKRVILKDKESLSGKKVSE